MATGGIGLAGKGFVGRLTLSIPYNPTQHTARRTTRVSKSRKQNPASWVAVCAGVEATFQVTSAFGSGPPA
jgi:hypothetical protein